MRSPTAWSLKYLRANGFTTQVVEKWAPFAKKRIDLFGCIDILAVKESIILGVQATSTSNMSSRLAKALAEPKLEDWLRAGGLFEVWGLAKKGKAGSRKLWTLDRQPVLWPPCLEVSIPGSVVRQDVYHPSCE